MKKVTLTHRKSFYRSIMTVAIAALSVGFVSCEKDDKDKEPGGFKVTAEDVEGGSSKIATVKALLDGDELADAAYKNDGFSITLPEPKSRYLEEVLEGFDAEGCTLDGFYAYDDDDDEIGQFLHAKISSSDEMTLAMYIYVDEDLEIDESDRYFTIEIDAKKGWNILYIISDDPDLESGTLTTKKQSGMRWLYVSGTRSASLRAAAGKLQNLLKTKLKQY
jgi:hypothetical protein